MLKKQFQKGVYRHYQKRLITQHYARYLHGHECLQKLGLSDENYGVLNGNKPGKSGPMIVSVNPTNNKPIAVTHVGKPQDVNHTLNRMHNVTKLWRDTPAPKRAELIAAIRSRLVEKKVSLAQLISLEMGKIMQESLGEVQEYIDVCDYAIGLGRQIGGKVIPSERPNHFMFEQYNPLGIVGIISAFNFPVAVYGWNAVIALVCGNSVIWKGAPTTNLCSVAVTKIMQQSLEDCKLPVELCTLVTGDTDVGRALVQDRRVDLVSFTGSTHVGRQVGMEVQSRFGRSILELGGNNACIIMNDADIDIAVRSTLFAAVGTAGQRCTTTRRLFIHSDVYQNVLDRLVKVYKQVKIGDPMHEGILCGPLHTQEAVTRFEYSVKTAVEQGGTIVQGGHVMDGLGNFVQPTIIEISPNAQIVQMETFAPILYVHKVHNLDEAIKWNNSVAQGLSSSLFTQSLNSVLNWTGPGGSDCGIVNVNGGTTGAEISGQFGGNKETGWGRESGSDAWKQYCRQSTCTMSAGNLVLAQNVKFDI